ncbi:MAG: histone deacetylase [Gammaproteobacteria bacterium]|nr:histone deacetylase [Gammaproteobacteria bacterium]MCW8993742.1 histone deacetylase [Gammaproteobacteria bacterium]
MTNRRDVVVFHDERMQAHQPDSNVDFLPGRLDKRIREILAGLNVQWKYPEHPGRLTAIMDRLRLEPVPGVRFEPGKAATRKQLARVHTTSFLEHIFALRDKNAWLDVDTTAVSPGSVKAAEVAAGTSIAAVEAVMEGRADSAFAMVRPPGHHAEPARARGFCLFNNLAVAAAHAQAELGCRRVLILDWDVHHGNGTQNIFWADPDVMFIDIHRASPFYPGSGVLQETGAGLGEGTTVNVPLPAGTGDSVYMKAMREIVAPAADYFKPDLILVSSGFDAHAYDLAMNVSYEGFAAMTGIVQQLADRHCGGRLVFILEGGYNLESLSRGAHSVLRVLAGEQPPEPSVCGLEEIEAAIAYHREAFIALDPDH